MRHLFVMFLTAIMIWSCGKESDMVQEGKDSSMSFGFTVVEKTGDTKSGMTAAETVIENINIFVYNSQGQLVIAQYSDDFTGSMDVNLYSDQEYTVYAIANVGDLSGMSKVMTGEGIRDLEWKIADIEAMMGEDGLIPFSGTISSVSLSTKKVEIPLTRLLAKFRVVLDTSALDGDVKRFEVRRVRLKNINRRIKYFAESRATGLGDIIADGMSYDGIGVLPAFSEGLDFYLPENAQGDLLPSNLEEQSHIPPQEYMDLCTYVEFLVNYRSRTQYNDSLIYRYYLHDGVRMDNFDVLRNDMYTCRTCFTGSGINENTWRIDVSGMKDYVQKITVSPSPYIFTRIGDVKRFAAAVYPASAENRKVRWNSSNEKVAKVSADGVVTASGDGICYVVARAMDGSGVSGAAQVIVNTVIKPESVTVVPDMVDLFMGDKVKLDARVLPEDATNKSVVWKSTDVNVATVTNVGMVEAVAEGSCMVVVAASAASCADTAVINVHSKSFEMKLPYTVMYPSYRGEMEIEYLTVPDVIPEFSLETISGNAAGAVIAGEKICVYNPESVSGEVGCYRLKGKAHGVELYRDFSVNAGSLKIDHPGSVYVGIPAQMTLSELMPSDVSVSWICSNTDIAEISASGKIIAHKKGTVRISAISETGARDDKDITIYEPSLRIRNIEMYEGQSISLNDRINILPDCNLKIGYKAIQAQSSVTINASGVLYAAKHNSSAALTVVKAYLVDYPEIYTTFTVLVRPAVVIALEGENRLVNTFGHYSDGRSLSGFKTKVKLSADLAPDESVTWEVYKDGKRVYEIYVDSDYTLDAVSATANGTYQIVGWNKSHLFKSNEVTVEIYQYYDYDVGISGVSTYTISAGLPNLKYYALSLHARWSDDSWERMGDQQELFTKFKIIGPPNTVNKLFYEINAYGSSSQLYMFNYETAIKETGASTTRDIEFYSPKSYLRGSFSDESVTSVEGYTGQYYKLTAENTGVPGLSGYYFIRQRNQMFYNLADW